MGANLILQGGKIMKVGYNESPHIKRVKAVFNGEWPDKIPICEQVIPCSVASEILGRQAYTGASELWYYTYCFSVHGQEAFNNFSEQVFLDTVDIHRKLDLDILFTSNVYRQTNIEQLDDLTFRSTSPDSDQWTVFKLDPASRQFGVTETNIQPPTMEQVVESIKERLKSDPHDVQLSPVLERAVREYGNEFVIGGNSFMSIPMNPGWLETSLLEPELICKYLDFIVEQNIASMELQRRHGIWLFNGGGDFAYNSGPIYSPSFFKEVMAPRWKRLFDWCRDNDAVYVFRSDGNLWPVADDLFGWGNPHAYYEVDNDAGMHFDKLRAAFPDLVLIGNVSCDILQRGTAEEVRTMTRYCLESAAPRVIIASANSLLHGTPVKNIEAMYKTAREYIPGPGQ